MRVKDEGEARASRGTSAMRERKERKREETGFKYLRYAEARGKHKLRL